MAKDRQARDRLLAQGRKRLAEWGISREALCEGGLGIAPLEQRVGQDPAADAALVELLGDLPSPEAASFLISLEQRTQDKVLRREIHRSLYKLSQKGVAVQRPEAAEARAPVYAAAEPEGYLSAIDGRGDRLVWLLRPRTGGLYLVSAVLNEPEGLRDVDAMVVSRKAVREMRKDLRDRHIVMIDAPWRYCDWLLSEGYERARAQGREVSPYSDLRSHVTTSAPQRLEPLAYGQVTAAGTPDEESALAEGSARLLDEEELRHWMLEKQQIAPYVEQMAAAEESPLVLNAYQQQDRLLDIVERAVKEVFAGELAAAYARRLEEMAFYFWATSRQQPARQALATAAALKRGGPPPGGKGIPFFGELVRRSLTLYREEEKAREKEAASGLIVTPRELAARAHGQRR